MCNRHFIFENKTPHVELNYGWIMMTILFLSIADKPMMSDYLVGTCTGDSEADCHDGQDMTPNNPSHSVLRDFIACVHIFQFEQLEPYLLNAGGRTRRPWADHLHIVSALFDGLDTPWSDGCVWWRCRLIYVRSLLQKPDGQRDRAKAKSR